MFDHQGDECVASLSKWQRCHGQHQFKLLGKMKSLLVGMSCGGLRVVESFGFVAHLPRFVIAAPIHGWNEWYRSMRLNLSGANDRRSRFASEVTVSKMLPSRLSSCKCCWTCTNIRRKSAAGPTRGSNAPSRVQDKLRFALSMFSSQRVANRVCLPIGRPIERNLIAKSALGRAAGRGQETVFRGISGCDCYSESIYGIPAAPTGTLPGCLGKNGPGHA